MNAQSGGTTAFDSGNVHWALGGAIAGVVGAIPFGALLWAVDPEIVTAVVPGLYGFAASSTAGWLLHLFHGLVLGVVFGLLVTRDPIVGTLSADVETGFIAAMGPGSRFSLAGVVYGLAVWTALPVLVQPAWAAVSGIGDPGFPTAAFESLVGHLLFGAVLGALFALVADVASEAEETEAPFEEASESPSG